MEKFLSRFEPTHANSDLVLWTGVLLGLLCLGLSIWLLIKNKAAKNKTGRMIWAMLLFFTGMISLGTSGFTFWTQQKTGPVVIYPDHIETVFGKAAFDQLKNTSIISAGTRSILLPGQQRNTTRLLLIEEMDGKAHVLSEDHYDIQAILNALRAAVMDWEKTNN